MGGGGGIKIVTREILKTQCSKIENFYTPTCNTVLNVLFDSQNFSDFLLSQEKLNMNYTYLWCSLYPDMSMSCYKATRYHEKK